MTKKDYVLIAEVMKNEIELYSKFPTSRNAIKNLVFVLADKLASQNPRFDYVKFYGACGLRAKDIPIVEGNNIFESTEQTIKRIKNEIN